MCRTARHIRHIGANLANIAAGNLGRFSPRRSPRAAHLCAKERRIETGGAASAFTLAETGYWAAMSRENVELVQRIYAETHDRPEGILDFAAAEIEWVNPAEAVEPGVRRGTTEVARALRNLAESFDSSRHELHEIFDAGEVVVASVSFCTRSRGSAAEVVQEEAHTWTLRDGRVVRFEWGRDLAEALEAVGLRE